MVHFQPVFDLVSSLYLINHHMYIFCEIFKLLNDAKLFSSPFFIVSGLFRYNKSLLGDDLGKFPAPLLMNTVHFSMQAVFSKGITWYWSNRFQTGGSMSWRDYFVKGKLIILLLCYTNLVIAK